MHKLVISDDEGKTTVVPLVRDEIIIGRKEGNTIRLTERNVSRQHARLLRRDDAFLVEDLGSSNGVKVNGRRIDQDAVLESGDQLAIGDYLLIYEIEGAPRNDIDVDGVDLDELAPPARLVMLNAPSPGAEFALSRLPARIGRADETDVVVNHRSISREHAEFVVEDGSIVVRDLKSANGVRVNGEEIQSVELHDGDVIDLGQVRFRYVEKGVSYVFDPADAERVATVDDEGPSRAPLIAALFIVAVAVAVGAAIAASGSKPPKARAPVPAREAISAERRAAELANAVDGCQRSVSEKKWDDAVAYAERAFAIDQTSERVHACRAEAAAGADSQSKFDRGVTALRAGNADDAYFSFEELAPDSPLRERPELVEARTAFVGHHLELARAASTSDPLEAQRQLNVVLAVDGLDDQARAEGQAIATRIAPRVVAANRAAARLAAQQAAAAPAAASDAAMPDASAPPAQPAGNPIARANACVRDADYACVVRALEGRAATPAQQALLIEAYRRTGDRTNAAAAAAQFVERYPSDSRTPRFRQMYLGGEP